MGSGIAQVVAQNSYRVTVWDVNDQCFDKSKKTIETSLKRLAKKTFKDDTSSAENYIKDVQSRIKYVTKIEEAVYDADLVVEAIVENLQIKRNLFKQIDSMASENTIFASNTSSMLISEIAEAVAQQRKSRFFGLHFFNPVPVMKLVEVISTLGTDPVLLDRVTTWVESIGKFPVSCKDVPGFIVNQLLLPYVMHAIMIYEEGAVSGRDIDTAMKLGAGFPMGPLELADHIGLDVVKHILESLYAKKDFSSLFVKCPETLERLVAENRLGAKTGEGFYKYN